jgi:hypothetical protein
MIFILITQIINQINSKTVTKLNPMKRPTLPPIPDMKSIHVLLIVVENFIAVGDEK